MYESLLAAGEIDAIRGAVADFGVGNSRINMLKYKPVEGMVVYAATGHCESGEIFFALTLYIQTDVTAQDIYIVEPIGGSGRIGIVNKVETIPLPGSVNIWHAVPQAVAAVATDNDRCVQCALCVHIAQSPEGGSIM